MEPQTPSTICDTLFSNHLKKYSQEWISVFNNYTIPKGIQDPLALLESQKYLHETYDRFNNMQVADCIFDLKSSFDVYLESVKASRRMQEQTLLDKREQQMRDVEAEQMQNEESAKSAMNDVLNNVIQKRDALAEYRDKLSDVFLKYGVTPADVSIDSATTMEELCTLYDVSLDVCQKFFQQKSSRIYQKLHVDVDTLTDSEGWYILLFVFLSAIFLSPVLLGIYVYKTLSNTRNIYTNVEKLKIASALIHEGDFERFLNKEDYAVEIDKDKLDSIDAEYSKSLEGLVDVDRLQEEFSKYVAENLTRINEECSAAKDEALMKQQQALMTIKDTIDKLDAHIEKLRAESKCLGDSVYQSVVLKHDFIVGNVGGMMNITFTVSNQNMMFICNTSDERLQQIDNMRIFLLNAMCNVKEKHLYVNIVDGKDLGTRFAEFFDKRFPDIVTLMPKDVNSVLDEIKKELEERIKVLKTQDIDTFNTVCEETGKVPVDYKIYLWVGDTEKLNEDKSFPALMKYSGQYGLWFWYLGPDFPCDNTLKIVPNFKINGDKLNSTPELLSRSLDTYADAYENSKDKGIDYMKAYASRYIPRDKWWSWNTKKGIELRFGLVDGDPDKGESISLGDAPVHGNMVGATGAGKSATINQLLASLITMYSPKELMLVMIDFKNVEFAFYADQDTHEFSRIPHTKVLAGTKDGEYAVSIFTWLCAEMDRRTAIFTEAGVKKLEEYRDRFPDAVMPRILILIDEYQVMFTEVDQKIVKVICDKIRSLAKLARFCGAHMLFTSQSMKGTMDKDVQDQFGLRVALRCSADTSNAVLGSNQASLIKAQFGYLYTNQDGGNTSDRNQLWRVPFIPTKDLEYIISELATMYKSDTHTEFYDEKRLYDSTQLDSWYDRYGEQFSDPHLFILGEKTDFSENKAPVFINTKRRDGENIVILGAESSDLANMILTLTDNIKQHDATLIMHFADMDMHKVVGVNALVGEKLAPLSNSRYPIDKLIEQYEAMVAKRKEQDAADYKPIYIFCGFYEKQQSIGRNMSGRLFARFENLLLEGPDVDIHFVMVLKNRGELPASIYKKFNHKIVLRCDSSTAFQACESEKPSKFPTNPKDGIFGYYATLGASKTFKLYSHTFAAEITEETIFIA